MCSSLVPFRCTGEIWASRNRSAWQIHFGPNIIYLLYSVLHVKVPWFIRYCRFVYLKQGWKLHLGSKIYKKKTVNFKYNVFDLKNACQHHIIQTFGYYYYDDILFYNIIKNINLHNKNPNIFICLYIGSQITIYESHG